MNAPLIVLATVLLLIICRGAIRWRLQLWHIMTAGAVLVLLTGDISPQAALQAIDWDIMVFLFGMFVLAWSLEASGLLAVAGYYLLRHASTVNSLIIFIIFGAGFTSALLMNDTIAIVGTPLMLSLARSLNMNPKLPLFALAFAITVGSAASPIGNPQNLLIAIHGPVDDPFLTFGRYLAFPSLINLIVIYGVLRFYFRRDFSHPLVLPAAPIIGDPQLARLAAGATLVLLILILLKITFAALMPAWDFRLSYIALGAALPILLLNKQNMALVRGLDWPTLIFFAAMFVLMRSVWDTNFFQQQFALTNIEWHSVPAILSLSVIVSQLISNVPLVALYLPILQMQHSGEIELMALAAGSTIAGNLFLLGAASNIIIVQNAERLGNISISFGEFARLGIPLTILNVAVYWVALVDF